MKIKLADVKRKSLRDDHFFNKRNHWFSSIFSIYFTFFFLKLKLNANQVTLIFFVTGLSSIFCFYNTDLFSLIMGYILFRLHIIFDMCDGEVARFNKSQNMNAKYWDSLIHTFLNPAIYFSLIINEINSFSEIIISFVMVLSVSFLIATKYNFHQKIQREITPQKKRSLKRWMYFILTELLSIEGHLLLFIFLKISGINFLIWPLTYFIIITNISLSLIKIYMFSSKKYIPYK